jgi:hypothetical protein
MQTKKKIKITFHQRGHLLAKAKAKAKRTSDDHEQSAFYEQSQSFRDSLGAGWQH